MSGVFFKSLCSSCSFFFYILNLLFLQTINFPMQELIDKLKAEAGLTDEQAKKAIETIKNFVVEKFPMLESAVGGLFGES